jgi:hypothetical protein
MNCRHMFSNPQELYPLGYSTIAIKESLINYVYCCKVIQITKKKLEANEVEMMIHHNYRAETTKLQEVRIMNDQNPRIYP